MHPFPHLIDHRTPISYTSKECSVEANLEICGCGRQCCCLLPALLLLPACCQKPYLFTLSRVAFSFRGGWASPQLQRMKSNWTKPNSFVSFLLLSPWFKHGHVMQSWPIKFEGKLSGRVFKRICFKLKKITKTPTSIFYFWTSKNELWWPSQDHEGSQPWRLQRNTKDH